MPNIRKIAHIIHPVQVDPSSDLIIAQPITFETMRAAREFSGESADITLYAVQYQNEERLPLPGCFIRTPDLTRSIADIIPFKKRRKLALIKDILDRLYEASQADYLIYTNVDIALMPYFYRVVCRFIDQGYDAFAINRRTISDQYSTIAQIPLMYAEAGKPHKGYDCFVFKRHVYPKFELGTICIGTAWIGRTLLANLVVHSTRFKEFRDEHLTFHLGDTLDWRREEYSDYQKRNRDEYERIFRQLEVEHGEFEPVWRSYLWDTGAKRHFPTFD